MTNTGGSLPSWSLIHSPPLPPWLDRGKERHEAALGMYVQKYLLQNDALGQNGPQSTSDGGARHYRCTTHGVTAATRESLTS